MAEFEKNETVTPDAESNLKDNTGDSRREALKRVGLAAAALTTTSFVSSQASAQQGRPAGQDDGQTLENKVIAAVLKDRELLAKLKANPTETVAGILGQELPAGVKINVVYDSRETINLVIPLIADPTGGAKRAKPDGKEDPNTLYFWSRWRCCDHGTGGKTRGLEKGNGKL